MLKTPLVFLLFTIPVLLMSVFGTWDAVEYALQDRLYQEERQVDADIVIIAIDEKSLNQLGQWPWPRKIHATLLEKLEQAGVGAVSFDIILSEPDLSREQDDQAFNGVLDKYDNVVLPVHLNETVAVKPLPLFSDNNHVGHIHIIRDADGVVRRYLPYVNADGSLYPAFSLKLAQLVSGTTDFHGAFPVEGSTLPQPVLFVGGPGHFETVSYVDVVKGVIPSGYFAGKTVLVGAAASGLHDSYFTSADRDKPMYGVEIHANLLQNFLQGTSVKYVSPFVEVAVICLAGLFGFILFCRLSLLRATFSLLLLTAAYLGTAYAVSRSGSFMPLFYPLLMLTGSYLSSVAARYVEEYRHRVRITAAFGRYVAPQVVDEIIKQKETPLLTGGQRRTITVMFIDIRGFTTLAEKAQTQEVVKLLNSFLESCSDILFQHGGTLDKIIGDGIMALFNAPLDQEDHAELAVVTAVAIMEKTNQSGNRTGKPISIGIGIHTGEAIVGSIGSMRRMDYTAVGDTVNLAARLEALADGGQIVISEAVYRAISDRFLVEPLGITQVRGRTEPVSLFAVKGIKQD